MNVRVFTIAEEHCYPDADVTFDSSVLEVRHGVETTIFPLVNVISFTTSESVSP